jgi:protein-tyrosine phosphatase
MAEGFLKQHLRPQDGFEIISAGIFAIEGVSPTPEAIEVMQEENIDISSYLSKPFSKSLAKSADIILVMAQMHKEFILNTLPEVKDKVYLFKEFADLTDQDKDITDPLGQPISVYKTIKEEIRKASVEIAIKIKKDKR